MGTSKSVGEFSRKIVNVATVTQRMEREVVDNAALAAKEIIFTQAASQGVYKTSRIAGGRWNVRYDTKGFNNPTALVRITGPFHLVNNDTRRHAIYRKGKRAKGKGSGRLNRQAILNEVFGGRGAYKGGALALPDGRYRHVVQHPGTKGKHIFEAARLRIRVAIPIVMSQRLVGGWRRALK